MGKMLKVQKTLLPLFHIASSVFQFTTQNVYPFEKSKQNVCNFQSYKLSSTNNYEYIFQWKKWGQNYAIDLNSNMALKKVVLIEAQEYRREGVYYWGGGGEGKKPNPLYSMYRKS